VSLDNEASLLLLEILFCNIRPFAILLSLSFP
jgi:hypothetical protein